jgi:hypothetical protein
MAHFAEIKIENNEVIRVVVINDNDINSFGQNSVEAENWVKNNIPEDSYLKATAFDGTYPETYWKRTSYNTINNTHKLSGIPFRGNYAGPGSTYDSVLNVFWPPKPFNSWIKNNTTIDWEAPVAFPTFTQDFNGTTFGIIPKWEETNQKWIGKTTEKTPRSVEWDQNSLVWNLA